MLQKMKKKLSVILWGPFFLCGPCSAEHAEHAGEQYPRRRADAVYHRVDALEIRRLGETAPSAGGVRQTLSK